MPMTRTEALDLVGEFADIDDARFSRLITLAIQRMSAKSVKPELLDQASVYMAGHIYLKSNPADPGAGSLSGFSAGDFSASYADTAGSSQELAELRTTKYGREFIACLRSGNVGLGSMTYRVIGQKR